MKRLIFLLMFVLVLPSVFAGTQVFIGYSGPNGASDTYTYTLNSSVLVQNTTYSTSRTSVSTSAHSSVTFEYADGGSYSTPTNTVTGGPFTVYNPEPSRPVIEIVWTATRMPATNQIALQVEDFWYENKTETLFLYAVDAVTGDSILNFCVVGNLSNSSVCTDSGGSGSALIGQNESGLNYATRLLDYQNLVQDGLSTSFNTTHIISNGSDDCLIVPWYDSSTACSLSNIKTYGSFTTVNATRKVMVSDEFSEVALLLSMSNQSDAFKSAYNTMLATRSSYGVLPVWVSGADWSDGSIEWTSLSSDTASDGTARLIQALWIASLNDYFSTSDQALYASLAEQMAQDHVTYETFQGTYPTLYGTASYLPAGGRNCANAGLSGCTVDVWIGYFYDLIRAMEMTCARTGNSTYCDIADDYLKAHQSVSLQNDTDGDGFGVAPFNFNYDTSGTYLGHQGGGSVNTYFYDPSNEQWDDSDAPRDRVCELLRVKEQTSDGLSGTYQNLSVYCGVKAASGVDLSDQTCLQFYYNGSCVSGKRSAGYYQNGLGSLDFMYYNTSQLETKLDEALGHYSWSGMTYDSTSCGTPLTYRGVRAPKALAFAMNLDGSAFVEDGQAICEAGNDVTETSGNITLTMEGNGSVNPSGNITLTYTVSTLTGTAGTPYNPAWECDFTSTSCGFGLSPTNNYMNITSTTSNDVNASDYTWTNHTMMVFAPTGANGHKFAPTQGGDKWILDGTCWKDENGFSVSKCGFTLDAWSEVTFLTNGTTNTSSVCFGGSCSTTTTGTFDVVPTQDSIQFETTYAGGKVAVTNMTMRVPDSEAPTSGGGADTLNVTLINQTGGTSVFQQNNSIANGTTLEYDISNLPDGTYYWSVNVSDSGGSLEGSTIYFSVSIPSPVDAYCTETGEISITNVTTSTYTLTAYNISNSTYENKTESFNITINTTQYWDNHTFEVANGYGLVQALKLWLNTTINSFTVTNGEYQGSTTNGSLEIPLSNGSNTLTVNVTGNYTRTAECTLYGYLNYSYCNATDIHDSFLIVTVVNTYANASVTEFVLNGTNLTISSDLLFNDSTTNGTVYIPLLQGYSYLLGLNATDYTTEEATVLVNENTEYYTFSVDPLGAINITILDEETSALITENVTITITNNFTGTTNYTTTGGYFQSNIAPGTNVVTLSSANYTARQYIVTITTSGTVFLTAYLTTSTETVGKTLFDSTNNAKIEGVLLLMERIINGTWTTVESSLTDVTGRTEFTYVSGVGYRFTAVKSGYDTKQYTLDPILFTSYNVFLNRTNIVQSQQDFTGVVITYGPKEFRNDRQNNLNISILSPEGSLLNYSYLVEYPGGSVNGSDNNAMGNTFNTAFNITSTSVLDTVNITIMFNTSRGATRTLKYSHGILIDPTLGTWISNIDNTYGLSLFERALISTLIILIIAGLATYLGGALVGLTLGLMIYALFVTIGFLPIWSLLITFLVGFIMLAGRSSE